MPKTLLLMSRYHLKIRLFRITVQLLFLIQIFFSTSNTLSLLINIYSNENSMKTVKRPCKRVVIGKTILYNVYFLNLFMIFLFSIIVSTWFVMLILLSGDVHSNPGPDMVNVSLNSDVSSHNSSSFSLSSMCTQLSHNLSIVHYNVQSIFHKLDLLQSELHNFDIMAFTETWLNASIDIVDLNFPFFISLNVKIVKTTVMVVYLCM